MIRLEDKPLSARLLKELSDFQRQVDDHSSPIEKSTRLWKTYQKRKSFKIIETLLREMCPNIENCCYCEDGSAEDIDHFFPKSGYPELTFAWCNYLYACASCNRAKGTRFMMIDDYGDDIDNQPVAGSPKLINPRYENPMDFLQLEFRDFNYEPISVLNKHDKKRVDYTIVMLQLNRSRLQSKRKDAFDGFLLWIDGYEHKRHRSDLGYPIQNLKKRQHLSVWEEMRRIYRHERFDSLKQSNENLQFLGDAFRRVPEALEITFIPQ